MYKDDYKKHYTTIPFAIHKTRSDGKGGGVIAHQHREIELISVTEGEVAFYVDAVPYPLQKGDVLVIPPYSIHRANIPADIVTAYSCICFDAELLWDKVLTAGLLGLSLSLKRKIDTHMPYAKHLQSYIQIGCEAYEGQKNGWELEAIGCMHLLFGTLKQNDCFVSNSHSRSDNSFAQKVIDYISGHYSTPISSATTAVALYMNNSYFCRLFKKVFGCRFSDYVLVYRLEKAKNLLVHSNMTVNEIAFQCGFNSGSYFGKTFRQRFGTSPLSYRKSISGKQKQA